MLSLGDAPQFGLHTTDEQRKTPDTYFAAIRAHLHERLQTKGSVLLVCDNVTDDSLITPAQTNAPTPRRPKNALRDCPPHERNHRGPFQPQGLNRDLVPMSSKRTGNGSKFPLDPGSRESEPIGIEIVEDAVCGLSTRMPDRVSSQ